ncbi:MAG: MBL fold metallo-hydrolase [Deltaproteobacteria bacterium]|nr:MBL fold metallo-hydrolase [Deltaproteobacteria bacterium]
MIDCGLFQGLKELRLRNWAPLPLPPADITGVVLTHAHTDHSGYIPLLVKHHFHGRIYASAPTVELCKILLPDSGYLQEEDARFASDHGFSKHHPALPLYTYEDALQSLRYFSPLHNGDVRRIGDGLDCRLIRAGHLLGSRFIELILHRPRQRRLLFAGDIGRYDALITSPPLRVPEADYLIMEATYGDRLHPKEDVFARVAAIVNRTIAQGGMVLIPAFAVGRTQEMLYILKRCQEREMIDRRIPVYLNTPLGIDATDIYNRYLTEHKIYSGLDGTHHHANHPQHPERSNNPFTCDNLHLVHDHTASKRLNSLESPAIIIAGSGMLTGGRMLHHIKSYGPDRRSAILLVGYQAEGTRGHALREGTRSLKIHGDQVPIRCTVEQIESLSAHGDQDDLLRWLRGFRRPPHVTYLVHGEPEVAQRLAEKIRETLQWKVEIPRYLQEVALA